MATTRDLNVDDVDDLVEALRDAGLYVDFEPARMQLPGVWVNITGYGFLLAGLIHKIELVILTADSDPRSALKAAQPVFNTVLDTIAPLGGPTDDPVTGIWTMRDGSRRPGIAIPFDMLTTQEA